MSNIIQITNNAKTRLQKHFARSSPCIFPPVRLVHPGQSHYSPLTNHFSLFTPFTFHPSPSAPLKALADHSIHSTEFSSSPSNNLLSGSRIQSPSTRYLY